MPGVSFDRAATYYDATRGFPAGVDEQLRDAIVERTGATRATRFLELGIGTGRVALPFLQAGYSLIGADISLPMMLQLRAKLAGQPHQPPLCVADIMRLPIARATIDVAISVHVLHLVDDWQLVLRETHRVVRSGGWIVLANDETERSEPYTPQDHVWQSWLAILNDLAVPPEQRRARAVRGLDDRFAFTLQDLGATVERATLLRYHSAPTSAREVVGKYRERIFSSCWSLPDDIHAEAMRRLDRWLAEECADPDTPATSRSRIEAIIAHVA